MAAKIAEKILRELKEKKVVKQKTVEHTERVVDLCEELKNRFVDEDYPVNWKLLKAAAWLHDIAKKDDEDYKNCDDDNDDDYDYDDDDDDKHQIPENVIKVLKEHKLTLAKNTKFDVNIDNVTEIIKYHRGEDDKYFRPDNYKLECAILCICDKIDKLNKVKLKKEKKRWGNKKFKKKIGKAVKKCKEYLEKISNGEVLEPEEFEILCKFCTEKITELSPKF